MRSTCDAVPAFLWGILDRLAHVRRTGHGWQALCPAHDDRGPSLSVGVGGDGRVLLNCFAGCPVESVVAALGLTMPDLFGPEGRASTGATPPTPPQPLPTDAQLAGYTSALRRSRTVDRLGELRGWTPAAIETLGLGLDGNRVTIPVRDHRGALVNVLRYAPDPSRRDGPKLKALRGRPRALFPAPEMIPVADRWLFLVEGESDALRALSLGLAAVGVPGVKGWRPEWAERFLGRAVVVCFDCDEPGRAAADRIAADLVGVGIDVRVLDLDPSSDDGFDLTDFARAARTQGERDEAHRILVRSASRVPSALYATVPKSDEA